MMQFLGTQCSKIQRRCKVISSWTYLGVLARHMIEAKLLSSDNTFKRQVLDLFITTLLRTIFIWQVDNIMWACVIDRQTCCTADNDVTRRSFIGVCSIVRRFDSPKVSCIGQGQGQGQGQFQFQLNLRTIESSDYRYRTLSLEHISPAKVQLFKSKN